MMKMQRNEFNGVVPPYPWDDRATALSILAVISLLISGLAILIDIDTIVLLLRSSSWIPFVFAVVVFLFERLCILWWFYMIYSQYWSKTSNIRMISLLVTGIAFVVVLAALILVSLQLYMVVHSFVQVLMHPFVIEFITFLITDVVAIFLAIRMDVSVIPNYYLPMELNMPSYPQEMQYYSNKKPEQARAGQFYAFVEP